MLAHKFHLCESNSPLGYHVHIFFYPKLSQSKRRWVLSCVANNCYCVVWLFLYSFVCKFLCKSQIDLLICPNDDDSMSTEEQQRRRISHGISPFEIIAHKKIAQKITIIHICERLLEVEHTHVSVCTPKSSFSSGTPKNKCRRRTDEWDIWYTAIGLSIYVLRIRIAR